MSFVNRQAAHCDICSHEWLVVGASTPTHCAKCKSRKWNQGGDSSATSTKPDNLGPIPPYYQVESTDYPGLERHKPNPDRHDIVIQALRDVCNGKRLSMPAEVGPMDKSKPLAPDAHWPDEHPDQCVPFMDNAMAKLVFDDRVKLGEIRLGTHDGPLLAYNVGSKPAHDPKTCRVYKCGMCSK
jgi:hypothetical protein